MSRKKKKTGKTTRRKPRTPRCDTCGKPLQAVTVRRFGDVLPIVVILAGSILSFRLIGLLILPLGAYLWTRTRKIETCGACAPGS